MIRTPPDCALVLLQHILKRSQQQTYDNLGSAAAGTATSCEPSLQHAVVQQGHEHAISPLDQKEAAPISRKRGRAVAAEQGTQHSLAVTTTAAAESQIPAAKRTKPINQDKLLSGLMKKAHKRAAAQHQGPGRWAGTGQAVRQKPAHADTHAMQHAHSQQQQQQQPPHEQQQQHQCHGLQQQGSISCMGGVAQTDKLATATASEAGGASHGSAFLAAAADALEQALARQGSCLGNTPPPEAAGTDTGPDTWQQFAPEASHSGGSGDTAADTDYADLEALWTAELQSSSMAVGGAAIQQAAAEEQSPQALLDSAADMPAPAAAGAGIAGADKEGINAAAAALLDAGSASAGTAQAECRVCDTATYLADEQHAADAQLMDTNLTAAAAAAAADMEQCMVVNTVSAAAAVPGDAAEPWERQGVVFALQQEGLRQQQQQETQNHLRQQQHQHQQLHLQLVHQQEQQQQQQQQWQYQHQQQLTLPEQQQQQQEACQYTGYTPAGSAAPTAPPAAAAAVLVPAPAQRFTLAELLFAVPELPIKPVPAASSKQAGQAAQRQQAAANSKSSSLPPGAGAGGCAADDGQLHRISAAAGGQQASFARQQQWQGQAHRPQQQQQRAKAQAQQLQQQQGFGPQPLGQPAVSPQENMSQRAHPDQGVAAAAAAAATGASSSSDEEGELSCSDNEAVPTGHAHSPFTFTAGSGAASPAAAGVAASQHGGNAQAPAAAAAGGGGGTKRAKKSRAGKKVRLRRAEAQRDAAAAAADGSGAVPVGLYAEIKAWEKQQAAKARKAGPGPVDAAKELRFSITGKAPCKFWQAGRCSKGESCPYLHAGQPAVQLVACKFHQRGACRAGESCKFSHAALSELPCPELALYHKCPRPAGACPYQHDALEDEVALALRRLLMKMQQQQEETEQQQHAVQAGIPAGSMYQAQQHQAFPMPQQGGMQDSAGYPGQQYPKQQQMRPAGGQVQQRHLQQWQQPPQAHMQQPHMMQSVGVPAFQQHPQPPVAPWPGGHGVAAAQQRQQQPVVPGRQQRISGIQWRG